MFDFTKDRFKNVFNAKLRFSQIAIAFQPIVDASTGTVWGYEALTRGTNGESYPEMIAGMDERKRMSFEKLTLTKALRDAAELGFVRDGVRISLNVRPTMDRAAVDAAFVARAAKHYGIPANSIVLELTEDAKMSSEDFLKVMAMHRSLGIATGIDDFGSGYSGLNVLATCGAEVVKLDRELIKGIDTDPKRQIIVDSFARLCGRLGSLVVAEGVETQREARVLAELDIQLMQGYYFGRPIVGAPEVLRLTVDDNERAQEILFPASRWCEPLALRA